jgi:CDP-6-deoxy-D-xylo-4-hexulose-3-dehydrase
VTSSVEKKPVSFTYPLAASTFSPEEIESAKAVLDSGRMTMGPQVAAFEKAFAQWVRAPYALMVNSGSSANLLMIEACLRRSLAKRLAGSGR